MDTPTFAQTQQDVLDLKQGQTEILALLQQKAKPQPKIETPVNIKVVAKLTELSIPTIYGYTQRNDIPFYKVGNRLKFFPSEIIDWIKTGKAKSLIQLQCEAEESLLKK